MLFAEYVEKEFIPVIKFPLSRNLKIQKEALVNGNRRVDWLITLSNNDKIALEVKSSRSDLYSGVGRNFVGNYNYFVIPIKDNLKGNLIPLTLYTLLKINRLDDVGIIVINQEHQDFEVIKESKRVLAQI